jgi:membrane protein implicated in regulation of membrane protease activity
MHHLLLILPLLGLILFIFLPWPAPLPLYVILLVGSLGIYWKIIQAQRRRPTIGKSAMIGNHAVVVKLKGDDAEVEYEGEIWHAISTEPLNSGQQVIINAVEGLTLQVTPLEPGHNEPTA